MSQIKFTPAPWYPINYAGFWSIQPVNDYSPSDLLDSDKDKNAKANARLMAAAPAMYEVLDKIIGSMALERVERFDLIELAKQAIEKARGEQTEQP